MTTARWKPTTKTKEPENLEKAYEYAVFLLSLQLRTVGQVLQKMKDRGYTEAIIEKTIERLKDQKYLDDQRYAEIFLKNLKTYRSFGYYGIKKKFMEKKIPSEIIERTLQEGLPVAEEIKIAKRFLKKEGVAVVLKKEEGEIQYRTYDEESSKGKAKIINRLKSRGFRGEVIGTLVF